MQIDRVVDVERGQQREDVGLDRGDEQLEQRHPSLYGSVCDERGMLRRHVNLFVNTSHVRDREGLDTALSAGDVITILPAVSGGSTCRNA